MEYENWIPTYPAVEDPLFQTKLAQKHEFQEVISTLTEPAPTKPGDLFKYQIFDKRFMRVYDRLLMFYEAGTGKTCGYLSVAEDYHLASTNRINVLSEAIVDYYNTYQGMIKNVIIILKGESLMEELKKQLVCRCTPGTYITESLLNAKSDKAQKSAVTRSIHQWYELDTYFKFANKLAALNLSDEAIAEKFNGTLFICDEIHSIKNDLVVDKKENVFDDIDPTLMDDEQDAIGDVTSKKKAYARVYSTLWKCFHLPQFCKVI